MPTADGDQLSPRERITGRTISFIQDIKAGFGTVGMFPVPRALQTNDLAERGELGLIVGNTPGKHGVCQVYILTRKSICHRTKFQVLRLDASVTHLISKDQNRDPQFLNVEPIPQDINILNETNTLPALPITSTSSSNTTIASIPQLNDSSLIRSDVAYDRYHSHLDHE